MKYAFFIVGLVFANIACENKPVCNNIDLMLFGKNTNNIISNWHTGMLESQFITNWDSIATVNKIPLDEKELRGLTICVGDDYSIPTGIAWVAQNDTIQAFELTLNITGIRKGQNPNLIYEEIVSYLITKFGNYSSKSSFNELYWVTENGSYYLSTSGYLLTLRCER